MPIAGRIGTMIRSATLMGLCGMFCLGSFSQQISWRTEVQECLLVPSNATGLEHAQWGPRGPFQLTYDIPIRYPAKSVTQFLCEDLQKNGWQAQTGCSEPATWWVTNIKTPTKSYPQYRWQGNFTNEKNDTATYLLDYTYAKDQDYLKTVHVNASCSLHPVEIPVRQQPESRSLVDKIDAKTLRFVLTFFFFLLLFAVPPLILFTRARSAVFYSGPNAWLTYLNLFFFSPVVMTFLCFGIALVGSLLGSEQALLAALGGALNMMAFATIGYFAGALLLVLAARILFVKELPGAVRITHLALNLATLCFIAVSIRFFSGPLIRW